MTPDKLEALRRLATHEDTPPEEARTAAMLYTRNARPSDIGKNAPMSSDKIAEWQDENLRLTAELVVERDKAASKDAALQRLAERLARAEKQLERAKKIVARTKDLAKAAALVKQGHDDLDREIREFEGRGSKEEPPVVPPVGIPQDPYRTGGMGWGVPRYPYDPNPTK